MTGHAWDNEPSDDLRRHALCGETTEVVALGTPSLPGMARQQELATGFALYICILSERALVHLWEGKLPKRFFELGLGVPFVCDAQSMGPRLAWNRMNGSLCLCGRASQEAVRGSLGTTSARGAEDQSLGG